MTVGSTPKLDKSVVNISVELAREHPATNRLVQARASTFAATYTDLCGLMLSPEKRLVFWLAVD